MPTVDDIVRMAIEDLFPDQTIPDKDNFRPDGSQYKAPDHAVFGGRILIERKSRNAVDNSQFYYKLQAVAAAQGKPFIGYGQMNMERILETLPDPEAAGRKMTDFLLGQMLKSVRDAKLKFEEHLRHGGHHRQLRVVVISDNTEIIEATDSTEYYLGRKMGGLGPSQDVTGLIDAIAYVKNPLYVLDRENSYWFKYLVKKRLSATDTDLLNRFVATLHHKLMHYDVISSGRHRMVHGHFRPLIV